MPIIKPTPPQKELECVQNVCKKEVADEVKVCYTSIGEIVLRDLITNDVETTQMYIGIELPASQINDAVPVGLPSSTIIVEEVERQKTWAEYCTMGRKILSTDESTYLLFLGVFDQHGNTQEVTWEQVKSYYSEFVDLLAPKEFEELRTSSKYKKEPV